MDTEILDPQYTAALPTASSPDHVIVSLGPISRKYAYICEICLDDFTPGQHCARSSCCNLRTHAECLGTWLEVSAQQVWVFQGCSKRKPELHATCPKCRKGMYVTSLAGTIRLREHGLGREAVDRVNVTEPALAFQEDVNHYFRQSMLHGEISRQLLNLAESRRRKTSCWNRWREVKREKRARKTYRWLSGEHKLVGMMYLGYARDWVALSQTLPPWPLLLPASPEEE